MEFKEFSAKTADEAIIKASIELGVSSENLEIQVVTEGSSGFFGIGKKPAIIKARRKEETLPEEPVAEEIKESVPVKKEVKKTDKAAEKPVEETVKPVRHQETRKEQPKPREEKKIIKRSEEEIAEIKAEAEKFLSGVFKAMELEVELKIEYTAEDGSLEVEFIGQDMGILIGKRGQTLDSLQHLVSLVINKHSEEYIRVKLDTENYRERRKETLEQLAKNIAYKVKRTRRPASLEPMNPYERRIIHSALQDDKFVYTKSEGEDPFRHVVVLPKKEAIPQRRYYKSYDKGYKSNYDRSAAGTRETAEKLTSEE